MATKVLEKSLKRECINTGSGGARERKSSGAIEPGLFVSVKEGLAMNGTRFMDLGRRGNSFPLGEDGPVRIGY
jgi:hypothetical protein